MAPVWIYDLNNTKKYREAVEWARRDERKPPARWQAPEASW